MPFRTIRRIPRQRIETAIPLRSSSYGGQVADSATPKRTSHLNLNRSGLANAISNDTPNTTAPRQRIETAIPLRSSSYGGQVADSATPRRTSHLNLNRSGLANAISNDTPNTTAPRQRIETAIPLRSSSYGGQVADSATPKRTSHLNLNRSGLANAISNDTPNTTAPRQRIETAIPLRSSSYGGQVADSATPRRTSHLNLNRSGLANAISNDTPNTTAPRQRIETVSPFALRATEDKSRIPLHPKEPRTSTSTVADWRMPFRTIRRIPPHHGNASKPLPPSPFELRRTSRGFRYTQRQNPRIPTYAN